MIQNSKDKLIRQIGTSQEGREMTIVDKLILSQMLRNIIDKIQHKSLGMINLHSIVLYLNTW